MATAKNDYFVDRVVDYAFYIVTIKNALKLLEEKLLMAETNPSEDSREAVLKEIHRIQSANELLELITLRKIGDFAKD